jgi:hypothetical protein
MCFVVHKTTSELECVILTTLYLVGAKNTDRNTLIDSVYEIVQYFVSHYDISVVNDQGDEGSPDAQSLAPMYLMFVWCNK